MWRSSVDALTTALARHRGMHFRLQDGREKILALGGRERQTVLAAALRGPQT
jgi:hypothetical protein